MVPDYQLSLAIGKEGQNARLAARLTGYKIDIKSETQARESGDFFDYENDYDEYDDEYYDDEYADDTYAEDTYTDEIYDDEPYDDSEYEGDAESEAEYAGDESMEDAPDVGEESVDEE